MHLEELVKFIDNKVFPIHWPGNWIDQEWKVIEKSDIKSSSLNPSRGTELISFFEHKSTTELAVGKALETRECARNLSIEGRLKIIQAISSALADYQSSIIKLMQVESGKPAWEARSDMEAALEHIDSIYKEGEAVFDKLLGPAKIGGLSGSIRPKPVGITAAYLPFSTPITSFVSYITASILAGCPLVLYSSTNAAASALLFSKILEKLELPKGLIQVIFGSYHSFHHAVKDKRVKALIYTGSREHCDEIRKESREQKSRQLILQSGGKNSVIVDESADLDVAVKMIMHGVTKSAGQLCTSSSRVFVASKIMEDFQTKLVEYFEKISIGPTDNYDDPVGPMMGPLYAEKSIERFLRYQTMAHREAKETLMWGKTYNAKDAPEGFYVSPGIHHIEDFEPNSAYQGNIILGPDIALYEFGELDQAIAKINDTSASFSVSYIGDENIIKPKGCMFNALNIQVNLPTVEIESSLPLPGRFSTGLNRFHGPAMALYLLVPQVIQTSSDLEEKMASWPSPGN